ncbi:Cytochrome c2 precursor [Roseivivax sp. THAF40]|uniref:c-type cytochrome n=1 Tax=unclassified Roseivivax TaxID=2639302 RepID=UPI0012688815|nr:MULTISPECIES: c-type cytochrome [unclassified Roseivivax]QFS83960.1 Cytochrome c2 precursor [Roseivivax sp. THAF197b]QFT47792.1 Cytochrome c2 precursor [Roseivivax sp. THAF40]
MRLPALLTCLAVAAQSAAAQDYYTLDGHGGPVMDVTVGPDGTVATASFDNAVGLWSDRAPRWLDGHEAAVNTVLFLSETEAVSGADDFDLIRWDLATGAATRLPGHQGKVMALDAAGSHIASASWDGTIGLWPLAGNKPRFLDGHDGPVNDVAFIANGARLYSASADGTLCLWDAATGELIEVVVEHGFGLNEIVLDEAAGWLAYGAVDGVTRVIDLKTGESLADLTLDRRPILALTRSADGSQIAIGDGEGYISVIATDGWRITQDFRATTRGPIWALAFSPSGENVHAAGLDTRVHSWPVARLGEDGQMQTEDSAFLADPASMPNGERQFKRKCSICHTLTPGSARRAGPSLYGLFGRRAGMVADYSYSDALDGRDLVWTEETVDALFDIGPEHYIPGTKMPMQRITGPDDRADLIAYLRRETAPKETLE